MEWRREGYTTATDHGRLDLELVHRFLRTSYWSPQVPREVVERSIAHSLAFGLYASDGAQVGFARVVTDRAVFAYLADVFVLEEHRGRGLGVWLVETVLAHPDLRDLRRIALGTRDAHDLYTRFGFRPADSQVLMTLDRSPGELYGDREAEAAHPENAIPRSE